MDLTDRPVDREYAIRSRRTTRRRGRPDGSTIAFVRHYAEGVDSLCMIGVDGSDFRVVVRDFRGAELAWSPDGSTFAFYSERDGGIHLDRRGWGERASAPSSGRAVRTRTRRRGRPMDGGSTSRRRVWSPPIPMARVCMSSSVPRGSSEARTYPRTARRSRSQRLDASPVTDGRSRLARPMPRARTCAGSRQMAASAWFGARLVSRCGTRAAGSARTHTMFRSSGRSAPTASDDRCRYVFRRASGRSGRRPPGHPAAERPLTLHRL